jgi:hypothetical protein
MWNQSQDNPWSDVDKAQWILENSWTDNKWWWIYTRVYHSVYREPCGLVPPWWNKKRQLISSDSDYDYPEDLEPDQAQTYDPEDLNEPNRI